MSRVLSPAATLWLGTLLVSVPAFSEELPPPAAVQLAPRGLEEVQGYVSGEAARANRQNAGQREAEVITERYPNRAVKIKRHVIQDAERNYVNHGSWTMFDPRGRIIAEGEYRNGKRQGSWMRLMQVFPMADPRFRAPFTSQAEFEDGELHGSWTIVDAQKRTVGTWRFSHGVLDGVAKTWYPNGQPRREMRFDKGNLDGEAMAWKPDGSEWAKEFFRDGKQLVLHTTWHERRQKESEGWYIRSDFTIHTNVDWWNGVLEIERREAEGEDLKTGTWTEWYANGTKRFEGAYVKGQPAGRHVWWHPNGQKLMAGNYRDGLAEGRWTHWHPTGMKHEEGQFLAGVKTGKWTSWSEEGQVVDVRDMTDEPQVAADPNENSDGSHNVSHILLNDGTGSSP